MTPDLFDWSEGERRRDAGMEIATAAQEQDAPGSTEQAYEAIVATALAQETVHTDDVATRGVVLAHWNAWGSIWRRAIRAGMIEPTGTVRKSRDPRKAAHSYPVYRSLIYRAPPMVLPRC